jgi:hypothetical protein
MSKELAASSTSPGWLVRRTAFVRTRPGVDWVFALTLAAIVGLMGHQGRQLVENLDAVGRRATYQSLSVLSGTMMGLTVTTAGLILRDVDQAVAELPGGLPGDLTAALGRSLFSSIRAWGYLCATSVILLMVDTTRYRAADWVNAMVVALVSLGALRVSRAIYALSQFFNARAQADIG